MAEYEPATVPADGTKIQVDGDGIGPDIPGSLILVAPMMLEHLGWNEAAGLVVKGPEGAVAAETVTYDLERPMQGATLLKTSEFAEAIVDHMH